ETDGGLTGIESGNRRAERVCAQTLSGTDIGHVLGDLTDLTLHGGHLLRVGTTGNGSLSQCSRQSALAACATGTGTRLRPAHHLPAVLGGSFEGLGRVETPWIEGHVGHETKQAGEYGHFPLQVAAAARVLDIEDALSHDR